MPTKYKRRVFFLILVSLSALCGCAKKVHAQVPVAIAPNPHPQFLNSVGKPLSNGFIYTYSAGTTTLAPTYVDSSGTVQNPNPIPLDSSGAPSNGSVQTGIWLANQSYKFCAFNAALVQQWCTDNVTSSMALLNTANTWTLPQIFTQPITVTPSDNQIILGSAGNRTTLDAPPPISNVTLHFPNNADTIVGRATTDSLSNKTLINPQFNASGCGMPGAPGTYLCVANASPTGTMLNSLAKLTNAPSQATILAITDAVGILGVCVSGCGSTGTAVIQQSGASSCTFDGATTAGDYVQASQTVAGNCHDSGSAPPSHPPAGALGQVEVTTAGGLYPLLLNPSMGSGSGAVCTDGTNTNVNANVNSIQVLKTCSLPAGSLNAVGKAFRLRGEAVLGPAGAGPPNSFFYFGIGTSSALASFQTVASETASATQWVVVVDYQCVVSSVSGSTGFLTCTPNPSTTGGTSTGSVTVATPTVSVDGPVFVGDACSFSAGSASNTCLSSFLTVEQLN